MALEPAAIASRDDFGSLLDLLECKVGAEIGVQRGDFSEWLPKTSKLRLLYSIDAWRSFPRREYRDICNVDEAEQHRIYLGAVHRLRAHRNRSCVLRLDSLDAAALFDDGTPDFVYLDANHRYRAVMADLKAWYPTVRSGGILGGHDFLNGIANRCEFGVRRAVEKYFGRLGLPVAVTEEAANPSWYVLKP